jgi:hypothetical protein
MTPVRYNAAMARRVGERNANRQVWVHKTPERSPNHRWARVVWILRCLKHGPYRANTCDFYIRKCPHEGGRPGFA